MTVSGRQHDSLRVEFLWDDVHVGAALFDEELIAMGPVAIVEVPGPVPSAAAAARRFTARTERGELLGIEVLRVEPRASGDGATVIGYLVRPCARSELLRTTSQSPSSDALD